MPCPLASPSSTPPPEMAETTLNLPFFCLALFLVFTSALSSERCNPSDKKVLLQFKKAFNEPYVLASWDPKTDCCDWYCVTCDSTTNRINSISIATDDDISGVIPPEVGDLPYLTSLTLRKLPKLTGPIPPAITKLQKLTFLMMDYNNLSGSVPSFLSSIPLLEYLNLSFNNLTGTIPSSLSKLPKLDYINLSRNKLTGSIPDSFGSLTRKFDSIVVSHNQLSGKIPASLSRLNFRAIDFSRNEFEGDASMLFGAKKTTQTVDLSRNLFDFDMAKMAFPSTLIYLDLNHNKITGSIPQIMTKIDLQTWNVSYNRLCGKIPVGGRMQSTGYSAYIHNKCLCGAPLDSCK